MKLKGITTVSFSVLHGFIILWMRYLAREVTVEARMRAHTESDVSDCDVLKVHVVTVQ